MSSFAVRGAMVPVGLRVRAYFAPVNRVSGVPAIFDPGKYGAFPLDSPPAPWINLGWIDNFQRVSLTPNEPLRAGVRGAAAAQFRGTLDARIDFDFREWGKLQMALAGGSEHMNVLATDPNAEAQPSGGNPLTPIAVLPGSSAAEIIVGVGSVNSFSVGDIIAVDADYQQQTGYVGTGISAAYVNNPTDVNQDADYIRRVTFNLGRVAQVTATSLILAQPLLGGAPPAGAGLQTVVAFVDREGGAFFQEWSALFVAGDESGGRICFHYPRLSPATTVHPTTSSVPTPWQREQAIEIAKPIAAVALHAAFIALPHTDENDGQIAVCYRSYFPAATAALY
ncbi:MAG: hypothetical protein JWN74_2230 [Acidobacteriaceae bacterium]|nr:hypothetical protein [Acidobacteriaceae bacterium]